MGKLIEKFKTKQRLVLSIILSLTIVLTYPVIQKRNINSTALTIASRIRQNLLTLIADIRNGRDAKVTGSNENKEQIPILYPTTMARVSEIPTQISNQNIPSLIPSLRPSLIPTAENSYLTPIVDKNNEVQTTPGIYSFVDNITNTGYIRTEKQATLIPVTLILSNGTTIQVYDIR